MLKTVKEVVYSKVHEKKKKKINKNMHKTAETIEDKNIQKDSTQHCVSRLDGKKGKCSFH